MVMPNFIIIGAGRAGTTSLYHYLQQHPQAYMSPTKETNFFGYSEGYSGEFGKVPFPITSLKKYQNLFRSVARERAIGEASPLYLSFPGCAENIKTHIPGVRIIVLLRNPMERAYSSYLRNRRDGFERRNFACALRDENIGRIAELSYGQANYVNIGFYYVHLTRYYDLFDPANIAVFLFDDMQADTHAFLKHVFRFLEIDEDFIADVSIRHNAAGLPRYRILKPLLWKSRFIGPLRRVLPNVMVRRALAIQERLRSRQLFIPPLVPELRRELTNVYRADVEKLQGLIQRDLSMWLAH